MGTRWSLISLIVAVIATAVAGGCDRGGGAKGPAQEVRIAYFANLSHAQAVLGASTGEFERAVAPAKLKTRVFNAGPSLIEALFADEVDIGYIGPGPAINGFARSGGKRLRVVAGASANGVLIVARKDSGISTLADLKGKKVATPQLANTQDIAAKHYLLKTLGQANTNNVVPVANSEQVGLMRRKDVDAAWAPEPWGSRLLAEADAKLVAEEKDLWPKKEFSLAVVIVRTEFLQRHPEVVEKVLAVHRGWTARLSADPKKCVPQLGEALTALTGKSLPPGVLESAVGHVKFTDSPLEETLEAMAQWTAELGFVKEKPSLEGLVDVTILRKLEAGGK